MLPCPQSSPAPPTLCSSLPLLLLPGCGELLLQSLHLPPQLGDDLVVLRDVVGDVAHILPDLGHECVSVRVWCSCVLW